MALLLASSRYNRSIATRKASRSRGATHPSFAQTFSPQRGSRECRVRAAPAVSCARCTKKAHTSIQVQRKHSGIPHAMALRLMPCSPRRRIPLVTVTGGLKRLPDPVGSEPATADLAPATGVRTTRFCRTRQPGFAKPPSSEVGLRRVKRLNRALTSFVLHALKSLTRFNPPCDISGVPTLSRPPHPAPRS